MGEVVPRRCRQGATLAGVRSQTGRIRTRALESLSIATLSRSRLPRPHPDVMSWIETIPDDAADGELAGLYDRSRDSDSGELDHIMAIHSLHPAGLAAHMALYEAVMRGTESLRKVERELIALVVSDENACQY
jgi:hypothetical protein